MSSELRREFLRLLKEDEEFRYTVLGYLGIDEVLKSIKSLQEQVRNLQKDVEEHTKVIKSLQEQVAKHIEILDRHSKILERLIAKIEAISLRYGVSTEEAFREAVKYLVEDLLKIYKVDKWIYYDKDGFVFGYPSVIEVDLLVKDKEHILVEYKAQVDKADVAELFRIGQLYERVTGIKPRLLIVSPSIRKLKNLVKN